jgi:hypothetical protein
MMAGTGGVSLAEAEVRGERGPHSSLKDWMTHARVALSLMPISCSERSEELLEIQHVSCDQASVSV